ncbi:hypothetical protein M405DRAFT_814162, partial [Rhizopogon salebrosus TDB-379]
MLCGAVPSRLETLVSPPQLSSRLYGCWSHVDRPDSKFLTDFVLLWSETNNASPLAIIHYDSLKVYLLTCKCRRSNSLDRLARLLRTKYLLEYTQL